MAQTDADRFERDADRQKRQAGPGLGRQEHHRGADCSEQHGDGPSDSGFFQHGKDQARACISTGMRLWPKGVPIAPKHPAMRRPQFGQLPCAVNAPS